MSLTRTVVADIVEVSGGWLLKVGTSEPYFIPDPQHALFKDLSGVLNSHDDATPPPLGGMWLTVTGSKFFDANGRQWIGRGANFPDFRGCNACLGIDYAKMLAEGKRRLDFAIAQGFNFFRYCIERRDGTGVLQDPAYYAALIDMIAYFGTKGVRVMVSLWGEASLLGGTAGPTAASIPVWQKLAHSFKDSAHVLFGISNEPEGNYDGSQSAAVWQAMQNVAKAIRDVEKADGAKAHVIVAQGVGGWSRDVNYYLTHPLQVAGPIAYECHPYDHESAWQARFGNASRAGLPIIAGEFGPAVDSSGAPYTTMDETEKEIDLFESLGIPYTAWTLHGRCPPNIIIDNSNGGCGVDMNLALTPFGQLLQRKIKQYSP